MEEPGPFTKAPPKVIHMAETRMQLGASSKDPAARQADVRTIIVREQARRGKERWHAIWVFGDEDTPSFDLVREFRTRQHHEQTYRVLLHDAFVDTAPSGYNKKSKNVRRPGFQQNALTLYSWIAALATNALDALTRSLPKQFLHAHPRTLRRWIFNLDADIFLGNDTLIVLLHPRRLHGLWQDLVRRANRHPVRIPWLENRRLILALDRPGARRATADLGCLPRSPITPIVQLVAQASRRRSVPWASSSTAGGRGTVVSIQFTRRPRRRHPIRAEIALQFNAATAPFREIATLAARLLDATFRRYLYP